MAVFAKSSQTVCPDCGRAVHRLPDGRLASASVDMRGHWCLRWHECLSRAARYPIVPVLEHGFTPMDAGEFMVWLEGPPT